MTQPPQLFDRTALLAHRARATTEGLFLHDSVAAEIQDRLAEVNRAFTAPAVISGQRDFWTGAFPDATHVADDEVLALTPGAHDLVIHALTLHWANDPVGQLVQARHALRPDGLFMGAMFGGQTLNELRAVLAEAESRVTGGLSPRIAPMGEIRDLGGLIQRAGLALPVADNLTLTVSYADAFALMRDLRAMGETNALANRLRRPTARAVLFEAARLYAEHFADADGRITATFEVVFLTGWAPDPSQQQPLRPGSAAARLADALNVCELPLRGDD